MVVVTAVVVENIKQRWKQWRWFKTAVIIGLVLVVVVVVVGTVVVE